VINDCVFCDPDTLSAAQLVAEWVDAIAIVPLNPVTPGHVIVIPDAHVEHAADDPLVTGMVFARAAALAVA
jgi:histidine triad (HIT) family protein